MYIFFWWKCMNTYVQWNTFHLWQDQEILLFFSLMLLLLANMYRRGVASKVCTWYVWPHAVDQVSMHHCPATHCNMPRDTSNGLLSLKNSHSVTGEECGTHTNNFHFYSSWYQYLVSKIVFLVIFEFQYYSIQ